jgi:hypothetical protein
MNMSTGVFIATHCQGEVGTGIENTVAPSVTGTMTVGETVTVSLGTWTGTTALAGSLRHVSDDTEIDTFTADGTYLLADTDFGEQLYLHVTAEPGGVEAVSAATSPVIAPDMALWLDASDASTLFQDSAGTTPAALDADPVGRWADKSGNGRHVTQTTAGARPALKLAIQNGLPVIRFATDDWLQSALLGAPIAQPNYILVVTAMRGYVTAATAFVVTGRSTGGRHAIYRSVSDASRIYAGTNLAVADATAMTAATVYEGRFDGASSQLWRDGTLKVTGNAGTEAFGALLLGANDAGNASFLNGDIMEVIVMGSMPAVGLQSAIRNYVGTKWGITINP